MEHSGLCFGLRLSLLLISLLLFNACRKNAVKSNSNYAGTWSELRSGAEPCGPYVLKISSEDYGHYYSASYEHECEKANKHEGKVKKSSKTLKIGAFFKLRLDQEPAAIDSVKVETGAGGPYYSTMTMVLNGHTYYKVNPL